MNWTFFHGCLLLDIPLSKQQSFLDVNSCVQHFNSVNLKANSSKSNVAVLLEDTVLDEVECSKFLGIFLDRGLTPSQAGVRFINKLSDQIRNAPTPKVLKTRLRRFLVSQAFYSADEFLAFDWTYSVRSLGMDLFGSSEEIDAPKGGFCRFRAPTTVHKVHPSIDYTYPLTELCKGR
ncbi:hypothetical protein J6590_032637 [Homalodisca vitripennis]|nr:hypothetical protein J6590_032637 [Homalodisca vitripennis]